ncbi:MAG: hypothetical protein IJU77_10410, partial [Butyrivibrio sp.]|nr:hypothetical protein [Butyrivibrio sp.]
MKQKRFGFRHLLAVMLAITLCVQTAIPVYAMDSTTLSASAGDITVDDADGITLFNEGDSESVETDDGGAVSEEADSSESSDIISGSEAGDETGYTGEGTESGSENPADDQSGRENADAATDSEADEIIDDPEISEEELIDDEEAAEEEETGAPVVVEKEENLLQEKMSGTCGKGDDAENVTWSYDTESKTLTIGGSGAMADY